MTGVFVITLPNNHCHLDTGLNSAQVPRELLFLKERQRKKLDSRFKHSGMTEKTK